MPEIVKSFGFFVDFRQKQWYNLIVKDKRGDKNGTYRKRLGLAAP